MLEDQEENIKDDVEYIHVHQDVIDSVQDKMPEEETLYDLAELFKIFGDSTRIRILYVLFESEMSHQLRLLKQARLVKFRREGRTVIYSLSDDHVRTIINQGMAHVEE